MKILCRRRAAWLVFLLIAFCVVAAERLAAATFAVTNANDSGAGSLRQAIGARP